MINIGISLVMNEKDFLSLRNNTQETALFELAAESLFFPKTQYYYLFDHLVLVTNNLKRFLSEEMNTYAYERLILYTSYAIHYINYVIHYINPRQTCPEFINKTIIINMLNNGIAFANILL